LTGVDNRAKIIKAERTLPAKQLLAALRTMTTRIRPIEILDQLITLSTRIRIVTAKVRRMRHVLGWLIGSDTWIKLVKAKIADRMAEAQAPPNNPHIMRRSIKVTFNDWMILPWGLWSHFHAISRHSKAIRAERMQALEGLSSIVLSAEAIVLERTHHTRIGIALSKAQAYARIVQPRAKKWLITSGTRSRISKTISVDGAVELQGWLTVSTV